jgi:hypothetical protein
MHIFLWILALLSTLAAGFFCYRADRRRAVPYPWLTAGLRALLVVLVWALLLAPTLRIQKSETEKPVILFLQDESASMPPALRGDTAAYRKDAEALLARLSGKFRVLRWGFGSGIHTDSLFRFRDAITDISAPLARAADVFSDRNLGAVILASDGRFNQGLHPLYQSLSLRSPVYGICIGDTALPKDLRIPRVYAPRTVAKGAQVELRADLTATRCKGFQGAVSMREGSSTLATAPLTVPSDRYDKSIPFSIRATTPGLHHYVVSVEAAPGEVNTSNNRRDVFIEVVESKKRVLIAAAAPHPDVAAIREALAATDAYTVSTRMGLPDDASAYEVVILHGFARADQPALRNKPVWLILGAAGGAPESPVASFAPAAPHDAYASLNAAFSAFSPPASLPAVLEKLPPLSVPPLTASPQAGAEVLLKDRESGAPLWLLQPGRPPAALLMGEGLWRWRLYEYRYFRNHAAVDECIRQTVALLAANTSQNPFSVSQPKYEWSEGEQISFDAYLLNAAGEQINTPDASLTVTDSAGKKQAFSFEKQGAAYRLNIGQLPVGSYSWQAATSFKGKRYAAAGSFAVAAVPLEAMESGGDFGLMYGLSKKYDGNTVLRPQMASLYDSIVANTNIRPVIESHEQSVPLVDWQWYFLLVLLVATAEWLLRKYWLAQ